jgi:hypothetical protein
MSGVPSTIDHLSSASQTRPFVNVPECEGIANLRLNS